MSTRPILNLGNTSELATNMKNPIRTSYHFLVLDPNIPHTQPKAQEHYKYTGLYTTIWNNNINIQITSRSGKEEGM